jgi:UDP-glucose 4-epimerase
MSSLTVLTTGGAGFIGSHTVIELLNEGHSVIAVDNCCNAYHDKNEPLPESLKRVEDITGKKVTFYSVDIRDKNAISLVFKKVSYILFLNCWSDWYVSSSYTETIFV